MKFVVIAGLAAAVGACSGSQETGADIANRINSACEEQYASEGNQAVTDCRIREDIKQLDRLQHDRERRVDQAVGQ